MKTSTLSLFGIGALCLGAASRYALQPGSIQETEFTTQSAQKVSFTTQSARSEEAGNGDPRDYPCAEIKKKHNDACKEHFAEKARQNGVNADGSNAAAMAAWVNTTCNGIAESFESLCKWTNSLKHGFTTENLTCYQDCVLDGGIKAQIESNIANKEFVSPEEVEEFEKYMDLRMSKVKMQCAEQCNVNPSMHDGPKDADPVVIDSNTEETDRPTETR